MSETSVRIRGLDTLLFRDGRPFSDEPGAFSARTVRAPLPGTVAGFLRTRIGNNKPGPWDNGKAEEAKKIAVAGPILKLNGQLVFHAPADALVYKDENDGNKPKVMCLRPLINPLKTTNIPDGMQPLDVVADTKPEPDYNFWAWPDMIAWLCHHSGDNFPVPENKIKGPPIEERVHVQISELGTSEEGKLFSAQFLSFEEYQWEQFQKKREDEWCLIARVNSENGDPIGFGQLGGESRPALVEPGEGGDWPICPEGLKTQLNSTKHVRMMLATPAIFVNGWKPGWLDANLTGSAPPAPNCKLKLVAAAVKRREPVSGWDYQKKGPKALRWIVPAGSVYFFEVEGDGGVSVDDIWLKSVSDTEQDQRDGYGLALWGIWNDNN